MATEPDQWSNVLSNAVLPVDVRKPTQVGGALSYVGLETMVSYIFRRVFKVAPRSVLELVAIHSLSLPFVGGLSTFADSEDGQGLRAPMGAQFMEGAKGIPGVFAGVYLANTFLDGLHVPRLDFKDILITAASKIATRPLTSLAYPYLGASFRNGQDAVRSSVALQRRQSRLNMD